MKSISEEGQQHASLTRLLQSDLDGFWMGGTRKLISRDHINDSRRPTSNFEREWNTDGWCRKSLARNDLLRCTFAC